MKKDKYNNNSYGLEKCGSHVIPITKVALFCRRLFGTTENRAVTAAVKNVLLASIYSTLCTMCDFHNFGLNFMGQCTVCERRGPEGFSGVRQNFKQHFSL